MLHIFFHLQYLNGCQKFTNFGVFFLMHANMTAVRIQSNKNVKVKDNCYPSHLTENKTKRTSGWPSAVVWKSAFPEALLSNSRSRHRGGHHAQGRSPQSRCAQGCCQRCRPGHGEKPESTSIQLSVKTISLELFREQRSSRYRHNPIMREQSSGRWLLAGASVHPAPAPSLWDTVEG